MFFLQNILKKLKGFEVDAVVLEDMIDRLEKNSGKKWSGFNPRKKNLSSDNCTDKNLKFWTRQFFKKSEISWKNILVQLAGQTFENFLQTIWTVTQFEILWKFSEIWELVVGMSLHLNKGVFINYGTQPGPGRSIGVITCVTTCNLL